MRTLLIFLIGCLSIASSFGQDTYKKGFLVSPAGDTSRVLLKEDIEEKLSAGVWVKEQDGKKVLYTPSMAKAFGFDGASMIFQSVTFNHKLKDSAEVTLFARNLISGTYTLYTFVEKASRLYLVRSPDNALHLLYNMYEPAHKHVSHQEDYRNKLIYFATSCQKMREIAQQVTYSQKSMIIFMYDVNDCVKPGFSNQQVNYKKPRTTVIPIAYIGGLPAGDNKTELTAQLNLRLTLPKISRTSFINTGVVYYRNQRIEKDGNKKVPTTTQFIGIPVTFQQNLTQGIVQPYVYVGAGVSYAMENADVGQDEKAEEKDLGADLIGGAGVDVYITQRLMAKVDWRYQIITHYPTIGIAYKFK